MQFVEKLVERVINNKCDRQMDIHHHHHHQQHGLDPIIRLLNLVSPSVRWSSKFSSSLWMVLPNLF